MRPAPLRALSAAPTCDRQALAQARGSHGAAAGQGPSSRQGRSGLGAHPRRGRGGRPARAGAFDASSIRRSCTTTRWKAAVVHRVAERLDHPDVPAELIRQAYAGRARGRPGDRRRRSAPTSWRPSTAIRPAHRFLEPVLYFKGFHAIQTHRLAHWLWKQGPQGFRALPAEPLVGGVPDRHPSGGARSGAASSSTTPPAWSSARPR